MFLVVQNEKFEVEEKKKLEGQDVDRIKKEKYLSDMEISTLKRELEMEKSLHESHYLQLEETSKEVKVKLEKQLKELECLLIDSGKKVKELEAFSESESRRWKNKEHIYQSFVNLQFETLKVCLNCHEPSHNLLMQLLYNSKFIILLGIKGFFGVHKA